MHTGKPFEGNARAALVTAHPGHELCVLGWLKRARPSVFVITDGSGRCGEPKLAATTDLLARAGAARGSFYGRWTDAHLYRAILCGDTDFFVRLAAEFADIFAREQFDYVACEAIEGYNPTHDLCRLLTGAALARANRSGEHHTAGYEFTLINRGRSRHGTPSADSIWLRLDDDALGEKLAEMRAHPHLADEVGAGLDGSALAALRDFPEIAAEVQALVRGMGPEAFRVEHLRAARPEVDAPTSEAPFYERYGQCLVRRGHYAQAIGFSRHVAPIAERLRRFAEGD